MNDWYGSEGEGAARKPTRKRKIWLAISPAFFCVLLWAFYPVVGCSCGTPVVRGVVCLSNLRQIGAAVSLYTQDYDNELPKPPTWMEAAVPYSHGFEGAFHCPELRNEPGEYGYSLNPSLARWPANPKLAETVVVFDSTNLARNAHSGFATRAFRHGEVRAHFDPRPDIMKAGEVFADGHARLKAKPEASVSQ